MTPDEFWAVVTHQASRPLTPEQKTEMAEYANMQKGTYTSESWAMRAACAYNGWGYDKPDYDKAFRYANIAVGGQFGWGWYFTGACLYMGQGVDGNHAEAKVRLGKAVDQQLPLAMYDLGVIYWLAEEDDKLAYKLFEQAATLDLMQGVMLLGDCHAAGRGCNLDRDKAGVLYQKALDGGLVRAQDRLNVLDLAVARRA